MEDMKTQAARLGIDVDFAQHDFFFSQPDADDVGDHMAEGPECCGHECLGLSIGAPLGHVVELGGKDSHALKDDAVYLSMIFASGSQEIVVVREEDYDYV